MSKNTPGKDLTIKQIKEFQKDFDSQSVNRVAMNAVSQNNLQEVALNRDVLQQINFNFTYEVETGEVSDQARANSCWLFANLNWLRTITRKKINVKEFQFSENYLTFFDKLEKSNYFLENMIEFRDRDLDDRYLAHLLNEPNTDGGEWHMTVNLIKKYGIVPKTAMLDTFQRKNTHFSNEILNYKLREGAREIRKEAKNGANLNQLRKIKNDLLKDIYRILVIAFGVPPQKFTWSYRDEDKKYHQEVDITPKAFYKKYVGLKLDDMYSFLSCPTEDIPYYKTVTVDKFNNMNRASNLHYLNVQIDELKDMAIASLKKGEACLFGCDVRYQSHTKLGIMDDDLYDFDLLFNTSFSLTKAERVDFLHVRLTHAMVFTGVELVDGKPVKWKVENSWGDKVGKKGYFIMSDKWFDEYVFDIVVHKKYITKEKLKLFEQLPIVLPPWHPIG